VSTETSEWLNQNVLIGFTDKRGEAWHYRASDQGAEPNHYSQAIPIDDVRRRLFSWTAKEVPMFVRGKESMYSPGAHELITVPDRKAIIRDDTHQVLGVVSQSYTPHQYEEVLLSKIADIVDDSELAIGSAGLLKGGAIAWVQIEMPENLKVADVEFRPHLLATTSFNGSIATTYKRTVTIVVCDNTRAMALKEQGQEYRVRHTANSQMRIAEARDALNIVFRLGEAFTKEIEQMLAIKVSDTQFQKFVEVITPLKKDASKTAITKADTDRANYMNLWNHDPRVAPWKGTGFAVVQAVNTYRQHIRPTRGETIRVERNMMDNLTGQTEVSDQEAFKKLLTVVR
jgi:phage/plasmid-like protein (TIGR03299 family)